MKFKAAMFDFDGTVTEKGVYSPSGLMIQTLLNLAKKVPIAFCTGRQLESFEKRGLQPMLDQLNQEEREVLLRNLFLAVENGSVGYFFDFEKGAFTECYRALWPEKLVSRAELMKTLEEEIREFGEIYYEAHRVIIVMRTKLHSVENRDMAEVYALSGKIYEIVTNLLKNLREDYENFLHVGDSGIGVLICPAEGDKDRGIREFGQFLEKNRNLKFAENWRDLLIVGDRPLPGGNDFHLLKGHFGTPFTVGDLSTTSQYPRPVMDNNGQRLMHEAGTISLIKEFF